MESGRAAKSERGFCDRVRHSRATVFYPHLVYCGFDGARGPSPCYDIALALGEERPRVSLLQRSPSSPVVCHATGFYPDRVVVFWRRDGQELHEQVDPGEVLPNHDGTFQVSVDLDLKAVPQEDWGRYECVVQLRGIEDISTPLDPALIRTNGGKSGLTIPIIIGFLVLLLVAAAAAVVGVLLYKKRNASYKRHKPVGSDTSSENTEGQNPAPEAQPLTTG
ncbi:unnamed protein product [Arctogadus glacialis]